MKVALLISGMFRHFEECYPTIEKNIINTTNCDVFVDTWKYSGKTKEAVPNKEIEIFENQIKSIKNIKKYNIEENFKFDCTEEYYKKFKFPNTNTINFLYMAYKMKSCFKLMEQYEKENNFKYDAAIKTRIDLYFQRPLLLEKIEHAAENDKICFPECQTYHGMNDQFFYSNRENIRIASIVYDYVEDLAKDVEFCSEKLLLKHLNGLNLEQLSCCDKSVVHYALSNDEGDNYFLCSKCFQRILYKDFIK